VKALRDAGKGPRDYRQGAEDGALFGVPCAGGCGARGWVKLTNAQANGCPLTLMRPFSPPTPATPARSAPRARPERWSLALRILPSGFGLSTTATLHKDPALQGLWISPALCHPPGELSTARC
jgi:hypothetical protein